ncbi:MAG: hypothetical protein KGJ84_02200 [Elusimicrobia bacterium]|nr:hypothetical protein [Elusimicrobiota bacterium]
MTIRGLLWVALVLLGPAARGQTLEVRADPRVDLVGLVQQLAGDSGFQPRPPLQRALARFAPWRGHPAVARLKRLAARGFNGNLPSQYAVYLTATVPLQERYPVPSFFAQACGGRAELDAFRAELDDFARQSGFFAWEASTESPAGLLAAALKRNMGGVDIERPLVDYLGLRPWRRWMVVPSVFFRPGGGSSWIVEEKPGLPDVYAILGPRWDGETPSFGTPADIASYAWAEPTYAAAYVMYEACRPLARAAQGVCSETPWLKNVEDCVESQWVGAVISRLERRLFQAPPPRPGRRQLTRWRPALDGVLARYEKDRARFPDLVSLTGPLFAPLQADRKAPACRLVDRGRLSDPVYARRLRIYGLARLARGPDPELERLRDELGWKEPASP